MEFRILGPLEVVDGGHRLRLAGRRQRALLTVLLLHANEVVASDRVIDELWGEEPPESGVAAVQALMSRLRRALGAAGGRLVETRSPGYVLHLAADTLDAERFERLFAEGRASLAAGDPAAAAQALRSALELWRGPALADFLYEPFAQQAIARLEDLRAGCLEARLEADLALGRHAGVIGELEALVAAHPLRERLRGQLMVALYRSGRQAEALEIYRDARQVFAEQLGIEPSLALRRLEAAILRQDVELESPPATPAELRESEVRSGEAQLPAEPAHSASPRRARKTVTVFVSEIGGSTRSRDLDPELRHRLGDRALEVVGPVLERHGASVERLRDGRVMGLFGVPSAHEDDALRAVRAASELHEALTAACDTVRTGIDTGEVLTHELASGELRATGGALDTAALLQDASEPGGIVIGEATRHLVGNAVKAEPVELPNPDGRAEPLRAWSLLKLIPGASPFQRRFDTPLVGRDGELAQLRHAFERANRERRAHLVTVFGEAGIGKTRLAQELVASVEGEATVLTGRCLSYGQGITYWPLREIVDQAADARSIRELLEGSSDADVVAERLESAIGSGTSGAVREEIFWATRRLVETLASESPHLLVFEDVHWGEPTLLDLIEHLADWVRDVPVLLVCLARPELLDSRPGWGGGKLNAASILLEPLSRAESSELISVLPAGVELPPDARTRITEAAEGNPLFLEQMLAMLAQGEGGGAEIAVPPAIQALLAARLDRLEPEEQTIVERASVEGESFHVGGLVALSPAKAQETVSALLGGLVRKELIRSEPARLPGEEAFRFRHALIRDAAYERLPKEVRSELHERYAAWLEQTLDDRVTEAEEFLGYHLEQAFRYRAELGAVGEDTLELAERARLRLASAGRLALRRGDFRAAVNLLERARSLAFSDEGAWLELAPDLGFALTQAGGFERAESVLGEAIERAVAAGERRSERHAWLVRGLLQQYKPPEHGIDVAGMLPEAEASLALFQEADDESALTRAWNLLWELYQCTGEAALLRNAAERALEHARRAGSRFDEAWSLARLGYTLRDDPTPVVEGARILERLLHALRTDPWGEATAGACLASLLAMQGRFEEARELIVRGRAGAELGLGILRTVVELMSARVETLAGDLEAAERAARAAAECSAEFDDNRFSKLALTELARAVCERGDAAECLGILAESDRYTVPPDWEIVVKRPAAQALALARLDRLEEAETFAREAVCYAEGTEFLDYHADALLVLAEVLRLTGRQAEAAVAAARALELCERKGNVVSAAAARALLDEPG